MRLDFRILSFFGPLRPKQKLGTKSAYSVL